MSDNWQQEPQYKSGEQASNAEALMANVVGGVKNMLRGTPFGSTQFDDRDLNDMIDLVEHANPEHLEMAGKALWDARDAIRTAADTLHKHIANLDWEGEGATQFHTWTQSLFKFTTQFETYAHTAGTEITTAATGLASVRKSMPPRDTRPVGEQKRPWTLPKAKQGEHDADYVLAKKVEKDRQDAINQMVRLGSFYSVAAGGLKQNSEPGAIEAIPNVGVPKVWSPVEGQRRVHSPDSSTPTAAVRHRVVAEAHDTAPVNHGTETGGGVPPLKEVHAPSSHPGHDVGTEINTVGTLPPPAHTTQPGPSVPTLPSTGGGIPTPPTTTGPMVPPIAPTMGRTTSYGPGGRLPISAQGRTGPTGTARGQMPQESEEQVGRSVTGGRVPQGPIGQAGRAIGRTTMPAGESAVRGTTQQAGRSPLGRGVTGGTPRMANASGERTGATGPIGAARNGVVGGKPVTGRTPGAASNSRVARGTVVGAEEPVSSTQPKGALGQRGVVGTPAAKADTDTGRSALRSAGNPEGVVGAPRNAAGSTPESSEAGARGAGLGRGAVGNRRNAKGETDRDGVPAAKQQHRPSKKQRRDAPQKRD
ncbi:WXG100 family type VII secretion target [Streptomyces sp. NPDC004561]